VLSGHSQGSLITAATVWFLGHNQQAYLDNLEQLRVITYGSQLQWAYPRLFPTYIGYTRLREINTLVKTGWYNLHRWTDPLGGPVLAYLDKPPRRRYSGQYPADNWKPSMAAQCHRQRRWTSVTTRLCGSSRSATKSTDYATRCGLIRQRTTPAPSSSATADTTKMPDTVT
jgi:hypothetical protein